MDSSEDEEQQLQPFISASDTVSFWPSSPRSSFDSTWTTELQQSSSEQHFEDESASKALQHSEAHLPSSGSITSFKITSFRAKSRFKKNQFESPKHPSITSQQALSHPGVYRITSSGMPLISSIGFTTEKTRFLVALGTVPRWVAQIGQIGGRQPEKRGQLRFGVPRAVVFLQRMGKWGSNLILDRFPGKLHGIQGA